MALKFAQTVSSVSWQSVQDNPPFSSTVQGPDSNSQNIAFPISSGCNALICKQLDLISGTTYELDLKEQVDLLNQPTSLKTIYGYQLSCSGSALAFGPAQSGGFSAFFGGSSGLIVDNGGFVNHCSPNALPVNSGSSLVAFNPTGDTTARIIIIGGN